MKISSIFAREILDSRGNPTINVKVKLRNGVIGSASVPSGASTGIHEALELRDGNPKRYNGKGVKKAVRNVNRIISPLLKGKEVHQQKIIDQLMIDRDGTKNKAKLGANAILGVSLACARAAAINSKQPLYKYIRNAYRLKKKGFVLPTPTMNILNGGQHAGWSLDIQEFMIVPKANLFRERVRIGAEVFHALRKLLKKKKLPIGVGDEGGFAPKLNKNEKAFQLIMEAIKLAGYKPGKDVYLAIDAAASEFYNARRNVYSMRVDKENLNAEQMVKLYTKWIKKYPLISIEDGLAEDDWDNWQIMTKALGRRTLQVGDDLFVTNIERLQKGIDQKVGNAILIKLNQIGSLSETIAAISLAQENGYKVIISHRSGETADTTIADLAVAVNAEYIKTGSLSRSERVEKYNRLMQIEEELRK